MILQILTALLFSTTVVAAVEHPLRVASAFTTPPLAFLRKGSPVGFEVEVLHHIATQMGREIQWIIQNSETSWQEEHYDVALGPCPPPSGGQYLSYYTTCWALLCTDTEIPNETELFSRPWAMMESFTPPDSLVTQGRLYSSMQGLLAPLVDLTQGKIPGWLHPLPSILYLRFAAPELHCIVLSDLPCELTLWVSQAAYSAVHEALQELTKNHILDTLATRWLTYHGQPKVHAYLGSESKPICDLSRSSL